MRRLVRVVVVVTLLLTVLAVGGVTATVGWRPILGPRARTLTNRTFAATPERLERGRYLVASGLAPCQMCHAELRAVDGRLEFVEGRELAGRNWAPDGVPFVTAANLTPDRETGAGAWTDDQLARAIREGIGHDGRALFPIMPYEKFSHMADEDLASVIAYLRSVPAVRHEQSPSAVPFPLNRLIMAVPSPVTAPVTPDLSTPEKRGEYLTTIAACADCHSPMDDSGARIKGLDFAGGMPMQFDGTTPVASANLTPSVNGIPYYTEDLFIETLRTGRVRARELASVMPTMLYRHMREQDMRDIFAYLKTLAPVDHYVDNTMPPTPCARCGGSHGGGYRNKALN
jgi:mono/diheme cytochrome c family protein